ncbi:MAG: hypothetical protein QXK97_01190 [Acidilobaceae archaeon]
MRDENSIALKWVEGYALVSMKRGSITLDFENASISLTEREIEVSEIRVNVRQYDRRDSTLIYLDFEEQLVGRRLEQVAKSSDRVDFTLDSCIISYTRIGELGYYITIQASTGFLYDFVIVTPYMVAIKTRYRRRAYIMSSDSSTKIFLV